MDGEPVEKGCLSSYLALTHVLGHERQHQTSRIRDAPNDQEGQYQILSTVSVRNSSYTGEFSICFWLYKREAAPKLSPTASSRSQLVCIMGTFDPMYVLVPPLSYNLHKLNSAYHNSTFSLGPILMGTIFNVLLYGIMIMQCYIYFQRFKQYV